MEHKAPRRINIDYEELENFLNYILDKTEECYYLEVEKAIKDYLKNLK